MHLNKRDICILAIAGLIFGNISFAEPAKLGACVGCHGKDGSGVIDSVPIIAGTPAAHLEEALFAYQDGARRCVGAPVMCDVVAPLSEAEILEFAEYYSTFPHIFSEEDIDARLARIGGLIHQEHCAICHVLPNDEDAENALGIPLHGQHATYLRIALDAYLSGDRETLVPVMEERIRQLDAVEIEALVNYYSSYQP
jgi:cytochrome c553